MARRRIIDPKFWTDPLNGRVSFQARLLYIGIWNLADDAGILTSDTAWLRASIFPHDRRIREQDVRAWIAELEAYGDPGRLLPYELGGREFYLVTRFHEHQTINRPTRSTLPRPPLELLDMLSPKGRRAVLERTDEPRLLAGKGPRAVVRDAKSGSSRRQEGTSMRASATSPQDALSGDRGDAASVPEMGSESGSAHGGLSESSRRLTANRSEVKGSEVNARARAEDVELRSDEDGPAIPDNETEVERYRRLEREAVTPEGRAIWNRKLQRLGALP